MSADFPWAELGMTEAGDRRAIKRAYAQRLKSCRPEDDSEGFARLRQAYEIALARAENDVAASVTPPVLETAPPRQTPDLGTLEFDTPEFDAPEPDALEPDAPAWEDEPREPEERETVEDLVADMATRTDALLALSPEEMARHLADDTTLWNLESKDRLSAFVASRVVSDPSLVPPAALLVLSRFFHWDDITVCQGLAARWVAVDVLQQTLHAAQIRLALESGDPNYPPLAGKVLRWGIGPRAWLHALRWSGPAKAHACMEDYPPLVARLVFGQKTVWMWTRLASGWPALGLHLLRINLIVLALVSCVRFPTYPESSVELFLTSLWSTAKVANTIVVLLFAIGVSRLWSGLGVEQPVPLGWSRRRRLVVLALLAVVTVALAVPFFGSVRTAFSVALIGLVGSAALVVLPSMVLGIAVVVGVGAVSSVLSSRPDLMEVARRNLDFSQPWLTWLLGAVLMMASHMALREGCAALRLPPMRLPSGLGAVVLLTIVWLHLQLF